MPLLLDRKAYEAQISVAFGMVQEMPYDELSHRGKRFLWPLEWGWRMPAREKGSSGHHCACGIPPLARRLLTAQRALNQDQRRRSDSYPGEPNPQVGGLRGGGYGRSSPGQIYAGNGMTDRSGAGGD